MKGGRGGGTKHSAVESDNNSVSKLMNSSVELMGEMAPFKVGIIGCGHLGTMVLTKMLEISGSFNNLQIFYERGSKILIDDLSIENILISIE